MKYANFSKIKNLDLLLLIKLDALHYSKNIFEINNYPDFDLTKYDKHTEETYFFSTSVDFPEDINTIFNISLADTCLFHYETLSRISEEYNIDFDPELGYSYFLTKAGKLIEDIESEGDSPSFDGFKLNAIKINSINNITQTISFLGGYQTDSYGIDPYDWKLIAFCEVIGTSRTATNDKFYLNLISEGYSLALQKNNTLSFFVIYSALENFTNITTKSTLEEDRLSSKINDMFRKSFPEHDLLKHEIYTSIIGNFAKYTDIRNKIAHGTKSVEISSEELFEFLIFALTMIATIETKKTTFSSLKMAIEQIPPTLEKAIKHRTTKEYLFDIY